MRIGGALKWSFLGQPFWFLFSQKKKYFWFFFPNQKQLGGLYHSFLNYGWFLQNLGKDFIPSIMHMTTQCTYYYWLFLRFVFDNILCLSLDKKCALGNSWKNPALSKLFVSYLVSVRYLIRNRWITSQSAYRVAQRKLFGDPSPPPASQQ